MVPGEAFGTPGYLRMSYALGDDDLAEGIGRIQKLVDEAELPSRSASRGQPGLVIGTPQVVVDRPPEPVPVTGSNRSREVEDHQRERDHHERSSQSGMTFWAPVP